MAETEDRCQNEEPGFTMFAIVQRTLVAKVPFIDVAVVGFARRPVHTFMRIKGREDE